jgi:hypothetical protein
MGGLGFLSPAFWSAPLRSEFRWSCTCCGSARPCAALQCRSPSARGAGGTGPTSTVARPAPSCLESNSIGAARCSRLRDPISPAPPRWMRPVTLVLADVSASLGGRRARHDLRDLVLSAIDEAPAGDAIAVARFAATCDLLVAPTHDRALARAAISQLTPGFRAHRVSRRPRPRGRSACRPGGRVVVITDLQAGGWTDGPMAHCPPGTRVDVIGRRTTAAGCGHRQPCVREGQRHGWRSQHGRRRAR